MSMQDVAPNQESRIRALRAKHSQISDRIEEMQRSPAADFYLQQLKKQKLILKDSIEQLDARTANRHT